MFQARLINAETSTAQHVHIHSSEHTHLPNQTAVITGKRHVTASDMMLHKHWSTTTAHIAFP